MSTKKPVSRLGKGIAGLVRIDLQPETVAVEPQASPADDAERLLQVPLDAIVPNPFQPRQNIDEQRLHELAESIAAHGVMQPITVRRKADGDGYELVAGERRWRAAQRLGLATIPARLVDLDDRASAELALVENVQRADLDPIERGYALLRLRDEFNQTVVELAKRIGQPRSTIANLIRLTELEEDIAAMVRSGELSLGHAKVLLGVPAGGSRIELAHQAVGEEWTVRRLEEAARIVVSGGDVSAVAKENAPAESGQLSEAEQRRRLQLAELSRAIGGQLNTRVNVTQDRRGGPGSITIHFFDDDQFEGLLKRLNLQLPH